jgi:DNA (cytosine-5)-methyltransferase 1
MKHLDLFSGIGGFAMALDKTGSYSHEFVEYEPHLQSVLKKHWPTSVIHGDIRRFRPRLSPFVVTGGFPCQDISRANTSKTKGGINGKRSGLWTEYFRVLRECRPKYCIIENVYDLLGNGLGRILHDLACIGYDSAHTVIDSQYTGVPQRRRRVYILGVRDGITEGADIFQNTGRSGQQTREAAKSVKEERRGVFKEAVGERKAIAYFTKQRTDEFNERGVASTIT